MIAGWAAGQIAAIMGAAFVASFASGLSGFAYALVASSILLHVLPPLTAVAVIISTSLFVQMMTLVMLRPSVAWTRLWPFLVGGAIGVPIGVNVLSHIDAGVFRAAVGVFLIAYSSYMLARLSPAPVTAGGRPADGAAGLLGGIMEGLAGFSGSIATVWCNLRGWPKDEQRAVFQPFIIAVKVMAVFWLGSGGAFGDETIGAFALSLPAMIGGALIGMALYRRVDDAQFRRIVLVLLLASGVGLLV
jgi:uncharacterized membrane protein YfcA